MGGGKVRAQGVEGEMILIDVESSDVLQERDTDEIGREREKRSTNFSCGLSSNSESSSKAMESYALLPLPWKYHPQQALGGSKQGWRPGWRLLYPLS